MYDPAPRRGPTTGSELLMASVFLMVIVGLFAAEVLHDYTPVKFSALLILLLWLPLIALHEAGHALAAHLLGWRVERIVVGMGKPVGRFRIGSAAVELRLLPLEGFVASRPVAIRMPRLESALIYFAGPGIELLLALGVLLLVGPDRMFEYADDYGLIFWQTLAATATWQAIQNLIPVAMQMADRTMQSDGLGIISSFLRPIWYYERMIDRPKYEGEDSWRLDE